METVMDSHVVKEILADYEDLLKDPEIYVVEQPEKAERFKLLTKKIYNFTVAANNLTNLTANSLPKLLIKGFGVEQIWQQLELQNNCAKAHFKKILSSVDPKIWSGNVHKLSESCKQDETSNKHSDRDSNSEIESEFEDNASNSSLHINKTTQKKHQEEYAFDGDSDSSADIFDAADNGLGENFNLDNENEEDEDSHTEMPESNDQTDEVHRFEEDSNSPIKDTKPSKKKSMSGKKSSYTSQVDDQFFKLSKLEEYLRLEDLKAENQIAEDSDEEIDIDLFQDIPSDNDMDEESDQEGESIKKSSKNLMYEDFFDAPESGDESGNESDQSEEKMELDGESGDDDSENEMQEDKDTVNNSEMKDIPDFKSSQKTAFELEQEIIKKKIGEYEKSMLEPLPWHLTGEIAASSRPIDSLVHHEAEFDSNVKLDHVTDSALNDNIENFIKKQIGNKAFHDVERKYKPTEEMIAYKKQIALDQTKSQKSLAEVYEQDYLKKQSKEEEEEEDPKHIEIKKLMDSLFPELQALFSHIPKPAVPEIKIVSNLPAITVEEVAPTSVSDATLLAPEEVKPKSGLVKGQTERTDTDRKRERRKKKMLQKDKAKKMKEKLEAQKANPSARKSKLEKLQVLKKLKQHRNTQIAKVSDDGKIKSSKDFFSRLQDTMDSKKTDTTNSKKKKVK